MVRPDLPPPANAVGSFEAYLAKARGVRRVGTLMGEKTGEGHPFVDLPRWFLRTGLRTFDIDTGLGVVKCCAPDYKTQAQMDAADEAVDRARAMPEESPQKAAAVKAAVDAQAGARIAHLLRSIREIPPGWVNEGEAIVRGEFGVPAGAPLPPPSAVVRMTDVEGLKEYAALLPASLLPQVVMGINLVALPPLAVDEIRAADPS